MAAVGPRSVGLVLAELARVLGLDDPRERLLLSRWEEAAGPQLAAACRPLALEGGRLRVDAASSVWQYELAMRREELKGRINVFMRAHGAAPEGADAVKEVHVSLRSSHGR